MEECVFCQIVSRKMPSFLVHEDEKCVVVLDIQPRTRGMCLVIPKKHFFEFYEDPDTSVECFKVALSVGEAIHKALQPTHIFFSIIPSEKVKHFHIRIYPSYGETPLFEKPPEEVQKSELEKIAESIRQAMEKPTEVPEEKSVEEEEKEKTRSPETIYRIRRDIEIT